MADKMKELILCFPSKLLDELGYFQGLSTDVARYFPAIVTPPHCRYVPRQDAERDPSYKQVIPYVLFTNNGSIFSYRRGKRGSEERLRELYSVGIGGHIEVRDQNLFTKDNDKVAYQDAMLREVREEVTVEGPVAESCVGLINDDLTDVGRVHFGVVHMVRLATPAISKKEAVITDSGLVPIPQAVAYIDTYETWSQLCLRHIDALTHAAGGVAATTQ
jgi:predicted NUDIX family phosphoesterase